MPDVAYPLAAVSTVNRRATMLSRVFPAMRHRTPDDSFDGVRDAKSDADADGILAELECV